MRTLFFVSAAFAAVGCGFYGDSTMGSEGRSEWRIDDGLCPGTEGGCAMTVPVAAGVELAVDSDIECAHPERDSEGRLVADCDIADFAVDVTGTGELRSLMADATEGRLDLRVYTVAAGDVAFDLTRRGSQFDRSGMRVRDAADIQCGAVIDDASWDMRSIDMNGSWSVDRYGSEAVTNVELGCRLVDSAGAPLFSAAAIQWQTLEGADISSLDDGGLFGGDSTSGARIYVRLEGSGTIRVEARFGAFARQLEVDVR